ncbi:MAG: NAD(P)-binding protein [Candidatus Azobacteroides sp.]|nr:NAD(P)-binding protein [Candidatus Azobacteroides sp.]
MKNSYDILIAGSGLSGSVCARVLAEQGYKVLVIEKKSIWAFPVDENRTFDTHFTAYS